MKSRQTRQSGDNQTAYFKNIKIPSPSNRRGKIKEKADSRTGIRIAGSSRTTRIALTSARIIFRGSIIMNRPTLIAQNSNFKRNTAITIVNMRRTISIISSFCRKLRNSHHQVSKI
jgi:hypothetical protein